jgi:tartrate dehydratase beta subunit/fumarate hydratase class I family protein
LSFQQRQFHLAALNCASVMLTKHITESNCYAFSLHASCVWQLAEAEVVLQVLLIIIANCTL